MTSSMEESHRHFLRRRFRPKFSLHGYSAEESALLIKYGAWLQALAEGVITPITPAQTKFAQVARGEHVADSQFENLWLKYSTDAANWRESEVRLLRLNPKFGSYSYQELIELVDSQDYSSISYPEVQNDDV